MSWELIYLISGLAILPVFLIAVVISINVQVQMAKYAQVTASGNLTGKQLVEQIAAAEHLPIRIEQAANAQGDHYDPTSKCVRLTADNLNGSSITALAVAAHECGHALQDEQNYLPLKLRNVVVHVSNFTSRLLAPLIIFSLIASIFVATMADYQFMKWVLLGFCIIYGCSALLNFITLPTEFDASRRGAALLQQLHLVETDAEKQAVRKVLKAAANTYVVAFALSLVYFLRYLSVVMIFFDRRQ